MDIILWYYHVTNKQEQKNSTCVLPLFQAVWSCLKSSGLLQKNLNYPKP